MEIYKNLSLEDLPNEEWRFIPNTDELYMISNMGRIKSVESYRVTLITQGIAKVAL